MIRLSVVPRLFTQPINGTERPMKHTITRHRLVACQFAAVFLAVGTAFGQAEVKPLLTQPTETVRITQGFRDWNGLSISGNTVVSGNSSGGRGGLFALDATTGKLKWHFRPSKPTAEHVMALAPIDSGLAVAAFGSQETGAFIAVSMATGKEVWRRANPARANPSLGLTSSRGLFYMFTADGALSAVDATGTVKWSVPFGTYGSTRTTPVVRDGVVYFVGAIDTVNARGNTNSDPYLFALDAQTGAERWRHKRLDGNAATVVVTRDTVYSSYATTSGDFVMAVDRKTGQERWKPIDLTHVDDRGLKSRETIRDLIEAGPYVVASTSLGLKAFETSSGRPTWTVRADPFVDMRLRAAAGNILYFEDRSRLRAGYEKVDPANEKAAEEKSGTLHAMDVTSQKVLWSFRRAGIAEESQWPFRDVLPVDGGLWASVYKALVKLQ